MGPGGPGWECYPQGSGAQHDKWKRGTSVLLSTGLGGSLQNPRSGETCRSGGGSMNGPKTSGPTTSDCMVVSEVRSTMVHGMVDLCKMVSMEVLKAAEGH